MKVTPFKILIAILFLLQVLLLPESALAEPISPDLIPPDVTLSPKHTSTTTQIDPSIKSKNAPGLSQGGGNNQIPARAVYGNQNAFPSNGVTGGTGVQPPPMGSTLYTGIPNVNQGSQNQTGAQAASDQAQNPDPYCVVDTNKGKITIRLFQKFAPKTVEAFISMINEGFYNGLTWHRYEPGFVIQGGCPIGNGTGLYIDPKTNQPRMLLLETSQNLRHNAPGVVAMAHMPKNPHSSSCQFYITLGKKSNLDFNYTIFGGVVDGLDVVFKLRKGDIIKSISMVK